MDQITGALVGIGLVLAAVFVPMAFLGGSTGIIYRQFSATIVSAMALSVLVAIMLTPALCATMLKPVPSGGHHGQPRLLRLVQPPLRPRQRALPAARVRRHARPPRALPRRLRGHGRADGRAVPAPADRLPAAGGPGLAHGAGHDARRARPSSARCSRSTRSSATSSRTRRTRCARSSRCRASASRGSGQNAGIAWINLKDWSERKSRELRRRRRRRPRDGRA